MDWYMSLYESEISIGALANEQHNHDAKKC